jgi:hypothetical protein
LEMEELNIEKEWLLERKARGKNKKAYFLKT